MYNIIFGPYLGAYSVRVRILYRVVEYGSISRADFVKRGRISIAQLVNCKIFNSYNKYVLYLYVYIIIQ